MAHPEQRHKLLLLLDHDNFRGVSIRSLMNIWIPRLHEGRPPMIQDALVRAYGGWYLGDNSTDARFQAAEFYQQHCPALHTLKDCTIRLRFEFADRLLFSDARDRGARITHTVAVRPSAQWVQPRADTRLCEKDGCELSTVRRWVSRKKACLMAGCPQQFSDQFERKEQKQVDNHLAADVMLATICGRGPVHLAVASDDWDFLPSIYAAATENQSATSITLLRARAEETYLDRDLLALGVNIIHCEEALHG